MWGKGSGRHSFGGLAVGWLGDCPVLRNGDQGCEPSVHGAISSSWRNKWWIEAGGGGAFPIHRGEDLLFHFLHSLCGVPWVMRRAWDCRWCPVLSDASSVGMLRDRDALLSMWWRPEAGPPARRTLSLGGFGVWICMIGSWDGVWAWLLSPPSLAEEPARPPRWRVGWKGDVFCDGGRNWGRGMTVSRCQVLRSGVRRKGRARWHSPRRWKSSRRPGDVPFGPMLHWARTGQRTVASSQEGYGGGTFLGISRRAVCCLFSLLLNLR